LGSRYISSGPVMSRMVGIGLVSAMAAANLLPSALSQEPPLVPAGTGNGAASWGRRTEGCGCHGDGMGRPGGNGRPGDSDWPCGTGRGGNPRCGDGMGRPGGSGCRGDGGIGRRGGSGWPCGTARGGGGCCGDGGIRRPACIDACGDGMGRHGGTGCRLGGTGRCGGNGCCLGGIRMSGRVMAIQRLTAGSGRAA
jgi:hypothetical protein